MTDPRASFDDLVRERLNHGYMVDVVLGVTEPGRDRRVVVDGWSRRCKGPAPDERTLFEIGSITKVLTALLLAEMVGRKEADWDEPVHALLPADWRVPSWKGQDITLNDLVTHTSGLPRMPTNFAPADLRDPYADYLENSLLAFIAAYDLPRAPGTVHEYSNLGFGLLGHALSARARQPYETLVRDRICGPLGMDETLVYPVSRDRALSVGHDDALRPTPAWHIGVLIGCGGLLSTAHDLLNLIEGAAGLSNTPLDETFAALLALRRSLASEGYAAARGWSVCTRHNDEIVSHDGGTGGYRSFCGFSRRSRRGVVLLSNSAARPYVGDLGHHLINGAFTPDRLSVPAPMSLALKQRYVGHYKLSEQHTLVVRLDGDQLFAQATGEGPLAIFPLEPDRFFFKGADLQLWFDRDLRGDITGVVLRHIAAKTFGQRIG